MDAPQSQRCFSRQALGLEANYYLFVMFSMIASESKSDAVVMVLVALVAPKVDCVAKRELCVG